jgi:hypothetical protein
MEVTMEQPDYKAKYHEIVKNFFPLLMVANAAKIYIEKPDVAGYETLRSTVEAANQSGIFDGPLPKGQLEIWNASNNP